MRKKLYCITLLAVLICVPTFAFALPGLQVYIEGSTAGDFGGDKDTWILPPSNAFNLHVVGSYGPKDISITNVTLLAAVLQGQVGTVAGLGSGTYHDTLSFLPDTTPKLNHFPLNKPSLYDFYTFDLGSLANITTGLNNYDADSGIITFDANAKGQDRIFNVLVTGYDYVHFDVYAKFTDNKGCGWKANPGSHDAADPQIPDVPEPVTLSLLGLGLFGLEGLKKRGREDR